MMKEIKPYKIQLKIIAEDMAKLYEHTDKIKNPKGEVLVDAEFNITEKEVDLIMIRQVKEILDRYQIEYTKEDLQELANYTKRDAVKKINRYRNEKGIEDFEEKDIEI